MLYTIVSDSIYDFIYLHPLCLKIIDTPEFQRLRGIKQCGPCEMVYPCATHNRFQHCLGVYHLAGKLLDRLKENGAEVTDTERLCVQIAGLCHDLGHGPYSHMWERFIFKASGQKWKHETSSVEVFQHLIERNNLKDILEEYGIDSIKIQFICNLIRGNCENSENEKFFLFQIICNKQTGIDVDKWDYIMRDSLMFNVRVHFDYKRILGGISVIECQDGRKCIGYRDKLVHTILDMFVTRAEMHRKCYQHPVSVRIELMLIDALIAADEYCKSLYNCDYKLSECHKSVDEFLKLSDYILYQIANSRDTNLENSRAIFKRISYRDIYPLLGKFRLDELSDEKKLNRIKNVLLNSLNKTYYEQNKEFCCQVIKIDFGTDGDPLENVIFFSKDEHIVPHSNIKKIVEDHHSNKSTFKYRELLLCGKWEAKKMVPEDTRAIIQKAAEILSGLGIKFEVINQ